MLQHDPTHRPSINEILYSKWMLGEVASFKQVRAELKDRDFFVQPFKTNKYTANTNMKWKDKNQIERSQNWSI